MSERLLHRRPTTMPPLSKRRLQVDERRQQLLDLGMSLFSDRTYDDISIDDIARAAGISKGLLYHYFPSKRRYYVETVRAGAQRLLDATEVHVEGTPIERARAGLESYLRYVDRHGHAYAVLLRSGIGADPEVLAIVERTRTAFVKRLSSGLGAEEGAAAFRIALRGWVGMVEAASLDWLDRRDVSVETLGRLFFDMLQRAAEWAEGR